MTSSVTHPGTDLLSTGSTALRNGGQSSLSLEAGEGALADTTCQLVPISTHATGCAVITHVALASALGSHRCTMP